LQIGKLSEKKLKTCYQKIGFSNFRTPIPFGELANKFRVTFGEIFIYKI